MRLALVPLNPIIGDPRGNAAAIADRARRAAAEGADLIVFPEMALCGYPPRDLLLRDGFLEACEEALRELPLTVGPAPVLLGAPAREGGRLFNSAFLLEGGAIAARYDKRLLPDYDVFDEPRYFAPGATRAGVFEVAGERVGVAVCEDLWRAQDVSGVSPYTSQGDPVADLAAAGVGLVVCLSASPFVLGKDARQQEILQAASEEIGAPVASINLLGANDELIFDGAAHFARAGSACLGAPRFTGETRLIDTGRATAGGEWDAQDGADPLRDLWDALVLGVRDYAEKTGFSGCTLGLSGGVDSALVCALACAALGGDNVHALSMPSRYSSPESSEDAREQCENTGARFEEIPIETMHAASESALAGALDGAPEIAGENVQARLRGLCVMAVSNARGLLALATGNKSELAVGYCTLYGDMNGGLAPIADLYKTRVYELARWLNARHRACGFPTPPIPERVLRKPPSAELRPGQTDQDSLPEYAELDAALIGLIEERRRVDDLPRERGVSEEVARLAARLLHASEHKRRQMAIGLKVSSTAFGSGRRVPVAKRPEAPESACQPHND